MHLDTVLCLDTSASMGSNNNEGINQLKAAARKFLEGVEETARQADLKENVAIVEFGAKTQILHNLSTNYLSLKMKIAGLKASGTTPMKDGLLMALQEIVKNGGVVNVNGRKLCPRIILMTDGKPTDENGRDTPQALTEVLVTAVLFGPRYQEVGLPHKIPIACVGCGNADKRLLESIAQTTGGMYAMVHNMDGLSTFFKRQVLLSRFIAQFAHDMAKLHSLLVLQQFMRSLGEDMEEAELRPFMALLLAMLVTEDDDKDEDQHGNFPKPPPVGSRVRRGDDWKYGNQDGGSAGTVTKTDGAPGWVDVQWDNGAKNSYRYGKDSALDVKVVDENRSVFRREGVQVGCRVIRGPDWKWGNQDGGAGKIGRVFMAESGLVKVRWPNGDTNTYRNGLQGAFDVIVYSEENVAIVEFGAKTQILHNLSTNYLSLKMKIAGLRANGTTPMKDGLLMALQEIGKNGGVVSVNGRKLCPRIILMTDGKPTDENGLETQQELTGVLLVAVLFGPRWQEVGLPYKIPIACVGCGNADKELLESIAKTTGGMHVMVHNMDELSTFFRRQVLLSRFIAQTAHDMAKLHSLLALQQFMQGLGEDMDEAELRPLMALLLAMLVADDDDDDGDGSYPKPPPVGSRVRRGAHWKWESQDGGRAGTIVKTDGTPGWVDVEWDNGNKNSYRYGKESAFDVKVVDENRRVLLLEGVQVGCRVIRGPDWKWGNQDGGAGNIGRVFSVDGGVVKVRWPSGHTNSYRNGAEGANDVLVHPADLIVMPSFSGAGGSPRGGMQSEACHVM